MKALTILQPYAHFVVLGEKRIENRVWSTEHRGRVAIHAGKNLFQEDIDWVSGVTRTPFDVDDLEYGAVIGVAELVRVVSRHRSKWFVGPHGFVLANARPIRPVPCPGQVRLWTLPPSVEAQVLARL